MIAVLPVGVEDVFDGPEVAGFVVIRGSVFDVVECELVLTGGCGDCSSIGTGSLEALIPVTGCVFLPTGRYDADRAGVLDQFFQ